MVEYWLEHLVQAGATHVTVLTNSHFDAISELVGNGARWGLKAEVISDAEYDPTRETDPASAEPIQATVLDHLPGLPGRDLFESYASWFEGIMQWMPHATNDVRIGVRELSPGVWVGRGARVADSAQLIAPVWLGNFVRIEADCVIGPEAVIEDRSMVAKASEVAHSIISPATRLGACTELHYSLAQESTLVNWLTGSIVRVPDPFLLGSLIPAPAAPGQISERPALAAWIDHNLEMFQLLWRTLLLGRPELKPYETIARRNKAHS